MDGGDNDVLYPKDVFHCLAHHHWPGRNITSRALTRPTSAAKEMSAKPNRSCTMQLTAMGRAAGRRTNGASNWRKYVAAADFAIMTTIVTGTTITDSKQSFQ